jgi:hypothetical protein
MHPPIKELKTPSMDAHMHSMFAADIALHTYLENLMPHLTFSISLSIRILLYDRTEHSTT